MVVCCGLAEELRMSSSAWPEMLGPATVERERRADARARLFDLHVELFVNAPARDRETIRAFEALALGFMPQLGATALSRAARTLAPCEDTPPAVLGSLFRRSAETRSSVLELAPVLPPLVADLLIGSGSARELAARPGLAPWTQERLLLMEDPSIDDELAANSQIALSEAALRHLVERAAARPPLARILLARANLGIVEEAALYLAADPGRQRLIRERIEASAVFQRRNLARLSREETEILVGCAGAGDVAGFEGKLSGALGFAEPVAWHFVRSDRHALLALALAAAGIEESAAVRIFLTLHPAISHPVRSVFGLTETIRSVTQATAHVLVEFIMGRRIEQQEQGSTHHHVPVYEPAGVPASPPGGAVPLDRPHRDEPRRLAG
jgi:hypothetical protein